MPMPDTRFWSLQRNGLLRKLIAIIPGFPINVVVRGRRGSEGCLKDDHCRTRTSSIGNTGSRNTDQVGIGESRGCRVQTVMINRSQRRVTWRHAAYRPDHRGVGGALDRGYKLLNVTSFQGCLRRTD